jgi:hypothetical protein
MMGSSARGTLATGDIVMSGWGSMATNIAITIHAATLSSCGQAQCVCVCVCVCVSRS